MRILRHLSVLPLALALLAASTAPLHADLTRWNSDHAAAQAKAREQERPILVLFTGSDWCPPCMRLEGEVMGDQAFYDWADQNVVLLVADFPRRKPIAPEQRAANEALRDRAPGFRGYPAMYLWDVSSNSLRQVMGGYGGGGSQAVIQRITAGMRQAR